MTHERLINPMFARKSILKVQMSHLFCTDSVIITHTVQFVHLKVNYAVVVELNLINSGTNFCRHSPDAVKL